MQLNYNVTSGSNLDLNVLLRIKAASLRVHVVLYM